MAEDHKYSQDQVNAILRRALERKELEGGVSHNDLVATAQEIGIAPADLERAIVEDRREREIDEERDAWIDQRRARLRQAGITWLFVNVICLGINLLVSPGMLWFFWVLVPWGMVLGLQAARLRTGPSPAQLERQRARRQNKLRRTERRELWRKNARVIEDVVEQGVNALVSRLEEHRGRLEGQARRPAERLSSGSGSQLDDTRRERPRGRRDD